MGADYLSYQLILSGGQIIYLEAHEKITIQYKSFSQKPRQEINSSSRRKADIRVKPKGLCLLTLLISCIFSYISVLKVTKVYETPASL